MCRYNKYIFFILILSRSLTIASTPENKHFVYQIGFGQNLNSYQWRTGLYYNRPFLGKGLLEVSENYNTSLIHLSGAENKWKDDQKLNIDLSWAYSPIWKMKLSTSAFLFSDKFSGIASEINTNATSLGVVFSPINFIELKSIAGYKYDHRFDKIDRGATYLFDIKTTESVPIKEYYNNAEFLLKGDNYSFRKNNDAEFRYKIKKYFQQDTYDSLSVFWTKKRRDNYDRLNPFDINVESLEEENRGFSHFLSYGSKGSARLELRTKINSRSTSVGKFEERNLIDERSKTEFHSENEIGIFYKPNKLELNGSLSYVTDEQKNEVPDSLQSSRFSKYFYYISPDYKSSRLTLSSFVKYKISKSDTIQLKGAISLFRYDTPENNMDDRDEFRMNIHLLEIHHFSPRLKFIFNGSVNLYHLVYIFGERSANNNWMRIFRLYPQVVYRPNERFSITQKVEVLANYVDYDFETGTSSYNIRSYVFRRFAISEEVNTIVTKQSGININYKFEIEENGKLNWDNWTETLLMNRKNHWLRFNLNYKFDYNISISPGFIFFKRSENKQNTFNLGSSLASQRGDLFSYGPTLKINYALKKNLEFNFEGMRRVIKRSGMDNSYINFINLRLAWYR
jgi:hypothetical protein